MSYSVQLLLHRYVKLIPYCKYKHTQLVHIQLGFADVVGNDLFEHTHR